jgi:hypothetical protein
MSNHQFPSGQWVGFYTYAGRTRKYLMDLILEFKGGKMTGEGADGIGLFVISGAYSEGECTWVKQYVGRHAVDYKGYREGKGIWGNWVVGAGKGGFHIWPLSEGGPVKAEKESEPEAKPVEASLGRTKLFARVFDAGERGRSK